MSYRSGGNHFPTPGFRLVGRNDDEKGRHPIFMTLCGPRKVLVILIFVILSAAICILSGYTRLPSDPPFDFAQGDRGVLRVTRGVLLSGCVVFPYERAGLKPAPTPCRLSDRTPSRPGPFDFAQGDRGVLRVTRGVLLSGCVVFPYERAGFKPAPTPCRLSDRAPFSTRALRLRSG